MKATVSRSADRITRIRFQVEGYKPWAEYQEIVDQLPKDKAKDEWVSRSKSMAIVDGWAEVTPR